MKPFDSFFTTVTLAELGDSTPSIRSLAPAMRQAQTTSLRLERIAVPDPMGNMWTFSVFVADRHRDDVLAWASSVFNAEAFPTGFDDG